MRKYIGVLIMAGLCGSTLADVITNAVISAFASDVPVVQGVADDVFQNATVTLDSGAHPIRNIQDLFTRGSYVTNDEMIFKDIDANPLSFVEFNTAVSYSLTNITIGLGNTEVAGDSNDLRSLNNVKIYARTSSGSFAEEDLIVDVDVNSEYTDAYGQRFLSLSIDLPSVNAQYFRAEFTEPLGGDFLDRGARVYEIDGYAAIPEPASLSLLVVLGGGLMLVRRKFMM